MIIKGHYGNFFSPSGKMHYLSQENLLLFGEYVKGATTKIRFTSQVRTIRD